MAEDEAEPFEDQTDDYVAARIEAYNSLVATILSIPEDDKELRAECMLMLKAGRLSFKTLPQGSLVVIPKEVSA